MINRYRRPHDFNLRSWSVWSGIVLFVFYNTNAMFVLKKNKQTNNFIKQTVKGFDLISITIQSIPCCLCRPSEPECDGATVLKVEYTHAHYLPLTYIHTRRLNKIVSTVVSRRRRATENICALSSPSAFKKSSHSYCTDVVSYFFLFSYLGRK